MIIGIDPGAQGAFALMDMDGALHGVTDMPLRQERVGRKLRDRVDALATVKLLAAMFPHIRLIGIEQVGPSVSPSGSFSFGRALGIVEGALAAEFPDVKPEYVAPQKWKAYYGLKADKAEAVRVARQLFPGQADWFVGPRGGLLDGRAEAALIARYFLFAL